MRAVSGLTLLELLLGLALGAVVMMALVELYNVNRLTYDLTQGLSRIQANGRLATALLRAEIRPAGFAGCVPLSFHEAFRHHGLPVKLSLANSVRGTVTLSNKLPASDAVTVVKMATRNADVVAVSADHRRFKVSGHTTFKASDWVVLTDCRQGDVWQVESVSAGPWLTTTTALPGYRPGAVIGHLVEHTFYVGNTGRKTLRGNPVYGLYVQSFAGAREELLEGVSAMQIEYGVCAEPGAVLRTRGEAVQDWSKVVSVHLLLTLDSVDEITQSGTKLSRPWPITIALRERSC